MKYQMLTAISAIAIMMAAPAFAQTAEGTTGNTVDNTIQQGVDSAQQGIDNAQNALSNAADKIQFTMFSDDKDMKGTVVAIDKRMTADGMLGEPVLNSARDRVGTVKDIILDEKGFAQMVVVSDAELIDVGAKDVAFDYSLVIQRDQAGDFIMPLTEEMIAQARPFSYDEADATKEGMRMIPAGGYSVEKLLEADVINPRKEKLASVDNISFKAGRADNLIAGFDKVLGMGGDNVALAFSDVAIVADGEDDYDFQLTASQAAQFEAFKQTASQ